MTAATPAELAFVRYLRDNGYTDIKLTNCGLYGCIAKFMFTHAILLGRVGNFHTYDDRWCYSTYEQAKAALDEWDIRDEPRGWIRHPATGRRGALDELETL